MDKSKIFRILGIQETKDAGAIKNAYREKLVQVNPEDDAEGFKSLREAYEEAIRVAAEKAEQQDNQNDKAENTPVGRWIKRVDEVYGKLSTRIDLNLWQELLEDELCRDFDTCSEASEALLVFLMDHYRLPKSIWIIIEECFHYNHSKEELYEKFPKGFVDFITEDPENKNWLDYSLFEGEDQADVDGLINLYLDLRRMNDNNNYEGAEHILEKLQDIELKHPYAEVEKLRYYLAMEQIDEAEKSAEYIKLKDGEAGYAKYYIAESALAAGKLEEALGICTELLEENPEHFGAKVLLASYYNKIGNYEEAKERYLELLELDSYNEYLREGMQKTNEHLIESFKEKINKEPKNKEFKVELAWCYYQNRKLQECLDILLDLKVDDEIRYSYCNLIGRTYMEMEEYDKGMPWVEKWIGEILKTVDDGTEENQKRLRRLGQAYYTLSRCYYNYGVNRKHKKEEEFKECLKYVNLALKEEKNTNMILMCLSSKGQALLMLKEYKQCIDVCDEIIRMEKQYYPAYLIRQEAYFNLKMAQEVIDDYYNAVEIYPGNASPYVWAIKVHHIYNQYEDAAEVLRRAKEAGAEGNELNLLDIINRRANTEDRVAIESLSVELEQLIAKAEKEPGDLKDITEAYYERALCSYDLQDYKGALKFLEKELEVNKSYRAKMMKAHILYLQEKYGKAITLFNEVLREYPEDADAHYRLGLVYVARGKDTIKEAETSLLKALEYDAEHRYANYELMDIYKNRCHQSFNIRDYNLALKHAQRQAELNPSCYYLTELGRVCLDGYRMEEAIKAFQEAISYDAGNPYPYNNIGYTYKIMGEYEKALEYFNLAIERLKGDDLLTFWNLADYYRITKQFGKAIETYEMILKKGGNNNSVHRDLLDAYKQRADWQDALEQAKKLSKLDASWAMDFLLQCADIYTYVPYEKDALMYYKQAKKSFSKKSKPYIKIGEFHLWLTGNRKKALKYFKKAYKIAKKYDTYEQDHAIRGLVWAYRELGEEKKGVPYVEEAYKFYSNRYGSIEELLSNPEYRKINLYNLAILSYSIGDYPKVRQYMKLMKESYNCKQCSYCTCYEYIELEGLLLESEKDHAGALEKLETALDIAPDNLHYRYKISQLKEKLNKG